MRPRLLSAKSAPVLPALLLALLLAGCMGIKYTDQPTATVDLTQPGAPAEAATRVLAKAEDWRNSGISVRKGAAYAVTATGRWRVWGTCAATDPDGVGMYGPFCMDWGNAFLKGWSHQALIAKVGEAGQPFGVGKALRFTAPDDGVLYFIINDTPGHFGDNEGYADVTVRALSPGLAQGAAAPMAGVQQTAPVPMPAQLPSQQAAAQPAFARKKAAVASAEAAKVQAKQQAKQQAAEQKALLEALEQEAQPVPQAVPQAVPPQAPKADQPQPPQVGPVRRVALVIGNGAYPGAPLRNPVNDARDVAAQLRALGFEVILRENASLRQMEEAVDQLWTRLKGGGAGLFFFAGHGLQVGGRNYLVPVDARLQAEQDVKYRCMDAGLVLGRMENAGNGLNIVILDACRNNPYARSWRSAAEGLAKMDAPKGSIIAYATAPDSVAADGSGRNGIYTGELLRHLRTPGLGIEEMFKRVRVGVLRETGDRQVPWESSSLTGWFSFSQ